MVHLVDLHLKAIDPCACSWYLNLKTHLPIEIDAWEDEAYVQSVTVSVTS